MGSAWGISRTMAEVHALLYITSEALCTDNIMERLQISRGNASMSLRALVDWGIVSRTHKRGDRKEYFLAESDVWTMFKTITRERKKRELDPVVASLYDIRDMTAQHSSDGHCTHDGQRSAATNGDSPNDTVARHNERLDAMLEIIARLDDLTHAFLSPEGEGLRGLLSSVEADD